MSQLACHNFNGTHVHTCTHSTMWTYMHAKTHHKHPPTHHIHTHTQHPHTTIPTHTTTHTHTHNTTHNTHTHTTHTHTQTHTHTHTTLLHIQHIHTYARTSHACTTVCSCRSHTLNNVKTDPWFTTCWSLFGVICVLRSQCTMAWLAISGRDTLYTQDTASWMMSWKWKHARWAGLEFVTL